MYFFVAKLLSIAVITYMHRLPCPVICPGFSDCNLSIPTSSKSYLQLNITFMCQMLQNNRCLGNRNFLRWKFGRHESDVRATTFGHLCEKQLLTAKLWNRSPTSTVIHSVTPHCCHSNAQMLLPKCLTNLC